jgi:hypothetical protein
MTIRPVGTQVDHPAPLVDIADMKESDAALGTPQGD